MKISKVQYTVVMFVLIGFMLLPPILLEAKEQKPLPYHFQNANIFYSGGKTHFEWYNNEAGRYSIYEYRYVKQVNGKLNFEPHVVWSKVLKIGNVRIDIPRKGIRWKVIYSGPK